MLRHRLTWWLDRAGVVDNLRRARGRGDGLSVLTYHRVQTLAADYAFDDGVADATPETFDEQLRWLKSACHVIHLDELREALATDKMLPANAVMLSFDDGYVDNHQVALPLLEKHGLPATFFIATRYIDERRLFWWDRLSYALKNATGDELRIDYPVPLMFRLPEERARAFSTLATLIKELHGLDLERLLDEVDRAVMLDVDPARERGLANELLMTWDHVRDLRARGMSVQSHTRWHRTMHTLDTGDLAGELAGSRQDLEERLGSEVFALAYPVGKDVSALSTVTEAIDAAGYDMAFTNATGPATLRRNHRYYIPRMAMEPSDPHHHLRAIVSMPELARELR